MLVSRLFIRAGLQLSRVIGLAVFMTLVLASAAMAQGVVVDSSTFAPPTDTSTVLGWVWKGVLALFLMAGSWAAWKLTKFLESQTVMAGQSTAHSALMGLTNRLWLTIQASGAKLIAKEKPMLETILGDGKVTPDEFLQLKTAIIADVKEIFAEQLPLVKSLLGGGTEAGLASILEGMVSKFLHGMLTGSTPAIAAPPPVDAATPQ